VTVETTELTLPSRIESVEEVAVSIARILNSSGVSEEVAFAVDMAVREAVTNAVIHGNKQDENKSVHVTARTFANSLEINVADEGEGFDPAEVPNPTASENILKSSGRGIFFIRNFMNDVEWLIRPGGGTTVKMTKNF
jgi:serine/threonine-protein kinase RsbW